MTQIAPKIALGVSTTEPDLRKLPPLQNGDHLTREEFERRHDAMPGLKWAELIEGRVYVAPPLSVAGHGSPHLLLSGIFAAYLAETPGIFGSDAGSIRLGAENMPQPDLFLMIQPECGGQAKIDEDGYLRGAPELIAEISASSVSYDLHEKLQLYRCSGVREYIVWRTLDAQMDYFVLREGEYRAPAAAESIFRSEIFPGLWVDASALIAGNLSKALAEVQKGIASPEHAAFVEALNAKANH
jgi:Uma2 family endonuclease